MTFLANENFPRSSIRYLRELGFEVISASETFHMASDHRIVEIASAEGLVILTMDKDYGKIVFKDSVTNPPPVYFFGFRRVHLQTCLPKFWSYT
jgi:predicted nuclease of predicted toxin-antitoxin system